MILKCKTASPGRRGCTTLAGLWSRPGGRSDGELLLAVDLVGVDHGAQQGHQHTHRHDQGSHEGEGEQDDARHSEVGGAVRERDQAEGYPVGDDDPAVIDPHEDLHAEGGRSGVVLLEVRPQQDGTHGPEAVDELGDEDAGHGHSLSIAALEGICERDAQQGVIVA